MVKRLITSIFLLIGALEAGAQGFPSELWYPGEIRLSDDTYVQGKLKYDLDHDAVQVQRNGRIETYSPQQVTSFTFKLTQRRRTAGVIKDEVINRHFFSLPFTNNVGYKQQRFFEIVVEGKATLLAREYITTVTNNANQRWGRSRNIRRIGVIDTPQAPVNTRRVLRHKMFLASLDGKIRELPQKRRDILYLFKDHGATMKAFVKQERLKLDQLYDVARLFTHYNSQGIQQSKAH